jgi:hypothetical protein
MLQGLHMRAVDDNVELSMADTDVDDRGQLLDVDASLARFIPAVRAWTLSS